MYAARNANLKLAPLLLDHGANPTMRDKKRRAAKQYAAERGADSEIHRFFYNLPAEPARDFPLVIPDAAAIGRARLGGV